MASPIISVGDNGARFTVYVAMDVVSTVMLAGALFAALTLALVIASKVK